MSKGRMLISICTTGVLVYYIVTNGMDVMLGITLALSIISNIINIYVEVKNGRKEKD